MRPFKSLLTALLAAIFVSQPASAEDAAPLNVPLIKLEYPGNPPHIRMLYMKILSVGNRKVEWPLLFDTGSSGMTIECATVLPAEMCSDAGIKIKKTVEIDGITVTTRKAVFHYGTYDEYGNVASARVTFGSASSAVSTDTSFSFLIRYKTVRRSTGEIVGGPLWPKGMFGVSPVGGDGPDQMLKSPLNGLTAGNGLRRGFFLSPIGAWWKICTNEESNCPQVYALHIGIPEDVKKKFNVKKWQRANKRYNFPTVESCIAWAKKSSCKPTLYDTGNSTIMIAGRPPTRNNPSLDVGVDVKITSPNHADWSMATTYKPEVEFVPHIDHNIVGIRYFEENSLLFDLESKEIGFRIGG
jgi:hypothetical protein